MSILGARPRRSVRRGVAIGALLALVALAVLVVHATRAAGPVDGTAGTRTGTASVAGVEVIVMTRTGTAAGSEAGLSLRPGASMLLLLPVAGAGLGALAARRPRASS